jgi:hypothetical protein
VKSPGLAGAGWWQGRGSTVFPQAAPGEYAKGNALPPITGTPDVPSRPGPSAQGGSGRGNQGGKGDGTYGTDPRAPHITQPQFLPGQDPAGMDAATFNHAGAWRGGIQGFNDKLTTRDRHAFWWRGEAQRTGVDGYFPAGSPNAYNNPRQEGPAPRLRTVNRTVSYQKGSDHTATQDDLTRPYTWLGEQGTGWSPIYGGVPGLYQPYGTRGGVPYPVQSPVQYGQQGDSPQLVFSGPPHGLHSQTPWLDGAQLLSRTYVLRQMTPVRIDRPSNSPQAGQSYSQTVQMQGQERVRPTGQQPPRGQGPMQHRGRQWGGQQGGGYHNWR